MTEGWGGDVRDDSEEISTMTDKPILPHEAFSARACALDKGAPTEREVLEPCPFCDGDAEIERYARRVIVLEQVADALQGILDTFNLGRGGVIKVAEDALSNARADQSTGGE